MNAELTEEEKDKVFDELVAGKSCSMDITMRYNYYPFKLEHIAKLVTSKGFELIIHESDGYHIISARKPE